LRLIQRVNRLPDAAAPKYFINAGTGQTVQELTVRGQVYGLAFSPDGKFIAAGDTTRSVKVLDVGSGQQAYTLEGHTKAFGMCHFVLTGGFLLLPAASTAEQTQVR
jgi:WD40 repeat protein